MHDRPSRLGIWVFALSITAMTCVWRIAHRSFRQDFGIPSLEPSGIDFRAVYHWASALRRGGGEYFSPEYWNNVYPPLTTAMFVPFTLLSESAAYRLYAVALWVFLFALIARAVALPARFRWTDHGWPTLTCFVLLAASYPVLFAIERGNSDITAAFLIVLFLGWMLEDRPALAITALTLATQMKVYPAILAALIGVRRGLRVAALFVGINVALLLALGWRAFDFFRGNLTRFTQTRSCWEGNHSLACYLREYGVESVQPYSAVLLAAFGAAALALYLGAVRHKWLPRDSFTLAEVSLTGMAFSLMSLVPSVSHDYKLPIHAVPFLLLLNVSLPEGDRSRLALRIGIPLISVLVSFLFPPREWYKAPVLLCLFAAYGLLLLSGIRSHGATRSNGGSTVPA